MLPEVPTPSVTTKPRANHVSGKLRAPFNPEISVEIGKGGDHEDRSREGTELAKEFRKGYPRHDMAKLMFGGQVSEHPPARGGRKAHQLDSEPRGEELRVL
jgi:hypothetical protein